MADDLYVIYGSEYSPFSVKVRSYFRYKKIPHEWRPRTKDNFAEFQALAKLPLIPLVQCPDGSVLQDSTPIMEKVEARFPDPSIIPEDQNLSFLSAMLEEYGDEWVNKPMFHYRWWRDEDQITVASGLAKSIIPNASEEEQAQLAADLRKRMVPRLSFVGSSEKNKDTIEQSLDDLLMLLEVHLESRNFLLGGCPSMGDFGLFGQLYGCTQQPSTARLVGGHPNVSAWIEKMMDPRGYRQLGQLGRFIANIYPFTEKPDGRVILSLGTRKCRSAEKRTSYLYGYFKGSTVYARHYEICREIPTGITSEIYGYC